MKAETVRKRVKRGETRESVKVGKKAKQGWLPCSQNRSDGLTIEVPPVMAARLGCNESELCQSESAQACRNRPFLELTTLMTRSFLAAFLEAHLREGVSL